MYLILYRYKHPTRGFLYRAHVETTEDLAEAETLQKEVGDHFQAPSVIMEFPKPFIPLTLVKNG